MGKIIDCQTRLLTITKTILIIVSASVAGGIVASAAPKSLSVTVVGADVSDLRWRAVEEAAAFWNQQLTDAGVDARLSPITQLVQPVPDDALHQLSESTLGGGLRPEIPEGLRQIPGDIVVTLSTADLISFGLREGPKAVIGIRRADIPPLSLPNVPRNVVAHLLGLVLGLRHNGDPTTLMCGRPAPCRPSMYTSARDQFFPLTAADRATLRARWRPSAEAGASPASNEAVKSGAVAYMRRSASARAAGRFEEAMADANKAVEVAPHLAAAYMNRSITWRMHNAEQSLTDANKALELEPAWAGAWNSRAATYIGLGQYDKALADATRAVELDPRMAEAWESRAAANVSLGRHAEGVSDATRAIELDPLRKLAYGTRAQAYLRLGEPAKAISDASQAISLDPTLPVFYSIRGEAYVAQGRFDMAIGDVTKAIELEPKAALYRLARAAAYSDMGGRDEEVIADASRAIELQPKLAVAFAIRARSQSRLGRHDRAVADATTAIAGVASANPAVPPAAGPAGLEPTLIMAHGARGFAYLNLGQYEAAAADFTREIDLNPTAATPYVNRGIASLFLWKDAEADADFKKAVSLGASPSKLDATKQDVLGRRSRPNPKPSFRPFVGNRVAGSG
jgi:tetratricopeptide (TPR) repeat protein